MDFVKKLGIFALGLLCAIVAFILLIPWFIQEVCAKYASHAGNVLMDDMIEWRTKRRKP